MKHCTTSTKYRNLFNTMPNFNKKNSDFICFKCTVLVDELEEFRERLGEDKYFSRMDYPSKDDKKIFKKVLGFEK